MSTGSLTTNTNNDNNNSKQSICYGRYKDGSYYVINNNSNNNNNRKKIEGNSDDKCADQLIHQRNCYDNGNSEYYHGDSDLLDSGRDTNSSSLQSEPTSAKTSISSNGYDESSLSTNSCPLTKNSNNTSKNSDNTCSKNSNNSENSKELLGGTTNLLLIPNETRNNDVPQHHNSECMCNICNVIDSGISSPTTDCIVQNNEKKFIHNEVSSKTTKFSLRFHPPQGSILLSSPPQSPSSTTNSNSTTPSTPVSNNHGSGISGFVNRIRSISLGLPPPSSPTSQQPSAATVPLPFFGGGSVRKVSGSSYSDYNNNSTSSKLFLHQEPDPSKLPKEKLKHATINFTSKNLRSSKKWTRMSHSLSCDVEPFNVHELSAKSKSRFRSSMETLLNTESSAVHRIEKFLSGHIDTSTPNGALLSVMKQGLRKVSESDRYLVISKSPLRSPHDFLKSGIEHLSGDSDILLVSLTHCTCYDLMPDSGKMVVLDSRIPINIAFRSLEDNGVSCALVWSDGLSDYIGVLSQDDIVFYLLLAYELRGGSGDDLDSLSRETLDNCIAREPERHQLYKIAPESVVFDAIRQLQSSPNDSLLVHDNLLSGNALFFLHPSKILTLLIELLKSGLPVPEIFKTRIGNHEQLLMPRRLLATYRVQIDSTLAQLLHVMSDNPLKCALVCLPKQPTSAACLCVHEVRCAICVDHIVRLTSESKHHDPHMTVESVLTEISQNGNGYFRSVKWCSEDDTLLDLMKLFVVDKTDLVLIRASGETCVHGIISAREIVRLLVDHHEKSGAVNSRQMYGRTMSYSGPGPYQCSGAGTSAAVVSRRQGFRSVSLCEDARHSPDMNLSAVSLDEKDEDVFNMEIS